MAIYVLGEAAVAPYSKTYTAKENGNVAHENDPRIHERARRLEAEDLAVELPLGRGEGSATSCRASCR